MQGSDDPSYPDDFVSSAIDPVWFDEHGIVMKDFFGDLSAQGIVPLPENALKVALKKRCDISHDGSPLRR